MAKSEFPKTKNNSIEKSADIAIKTLSKSNIESASEVWKEFIKLKQAEDESIGDDILRFEL